MDPKIEILPLRRARKLVWILNFSLDFEFSVGGKEGRILMFTYRVDFGTEDRGLKA